MYITKVILLVTFTLGLTQCRTNKNPINAGGFKWAPDTVTTIDTIDATKEPGTITIDLPEVDKGIDPEPFIYREDEGIDRGWMDSTGLFLMFEKLQKDTIDWKPYGLGRRPLFPYNDTLHWLIGCD